MARDHAAPCYRGNGPGLWVLLLRKGTAGELTGGNCGRGVVAQGATAGRGASPGARFALAKFRPTTLPATLVTRSVPHDQPTAGASRRLTGYHDGRGQPIQQAIATMMGSGSGTPGGFRRAEERGDFGREPGRRGGEPGRRVRVPFHRGIRHWLSLVVFVLAPIAVIVVYAFRDLLGWRSRRPRAWLLATVTARRALAGKPTDWRMPEHPAEPPARHPYLIMNPKSGGGKVEKFDLKRKAEDLGADVFSSAGPSPATSPR